VFDVWQTRHAVVIYRVALARLSAAGAHCTVALHVLTWLYDRRSLMISCSAVSGRGNAAALERSLRQKRDAAQNHNAMSK
jgi:hypothetical protein